MIIRTNLCYAGRELCIEVPDDTKQNDIDIMLFRMREDLCSKNLCVSRNGKKYFYKK